MRTNADEGPATPRHDPARPTEPWRDPRRSVAERVDDLLPRLTLAEKIAQLQGIWVGADPAGAGVAPHQHDLTAAPVDWAEAIGSGLGQLTRPFGTAPVDPTLGARALARAQAEIVAAGRFGIPALAHEECLTGFTTWGATIYPTPLAWGATFDPELVGRMAARIGAALRSVGVHQGLAPVLDVTRDPRWGRTEETIGEDPHLVGTVGTAYVRGLQSAGVIATLKHFVGYSASRAGRNLAPVAVGLRELADVLLPPFEMAVREGGARSVMPSYAEIDGVPVAADPTLLTDLLRERWRFTGTVVSDYFGVTFLERLHRTAADPAAAAAAALAAGVDVELPTAHCYGEPLRQAVTAGAIGEELVDRAARRVLAQKCELGLLDPDWSPEHGEEIDLDPPADRALASALAAESVVLLANDGTLPLPPTGRIAVVGPNADAAAAMLGCYTFPSHVGVHHPDLPLGVEVATVLAALRDELPDATLTHRPGCAVDGADTAGIAAAVEAARAADTCVVVLGDRAGLFGGGTSGEGCDATDLRLPGVQQALLDALCDTGTPLVVVLLAGRPYALEGAAERAAAVVQAFFPGEEGGGAVAGVLSGRICPSGRLPVGVPRTAGGQPAGYLAPPLGHRTEVSTVDPTARWPFGHGLSYTGFEWTDVLLGDDAACLDTAGSLTVSLLVRNTGDRAGAEVVQLYLHDPVAEVTRPVVRLIGYARVELAPGAARRVHFDVPAGATAFTGLDGRRIVEPGDIELRLSASSTTPRHTVRVRLTGPIRTLGGAGAHTVGVRVAPAP